MSVLTKRTAEVRDTTMAYIDEGEGRPIVFLHGNPTSSYLWRNVIPHVADRGRVIAPDLVGHGDSAKLPGTGDERYSLAEHQGYLDALLDQLGVDGDAVLVGHDWGGPLGFDWARRHPDVVAGIAYMETIVRPFTWGGFGEIAALFRAWRSPAGEELVLQGNQFVEGLVPQAIMRSLSEKEWAEYIGPGAGPARTAAPHWHGRARSPSTASPPTCTRRSPHARTSCARRRSRSCSSTCSPASRCRMRSAPSPGPSRTRPKSRSADSTSHRRTHPKRSVRHLPSSSTGSSGMRSTSPCAGRGRPTQSRHSRPSPQPPIAGARSRRGSGSPLCRATLLDRAVWQCAVLPTPSARSTPSPQASTMAASCSGRAARP
jgi:pimeloyl-ACP methyl ester carboxylesterase